VHTQAITDEYRTEPVAGAGVERQFVEFQTMTRLAVWLASGMSHAAHPCLRKTTRRSMFNCLLGNVKLVRYVLQLSSDYYSFF
jgi:hypothetical protein